MKSSSRIVSIAMGLLLSISGCVHIDKVSPERVRLSEPRIKPLRESEWSEEQSRVLNKARIGGKLLNISLTLARNPAMMERWLTFADYVLRESTFPRRERELLILRIGWLCQAEYEFGQHTIVGKWVGLTPEEIVRITKGPDAPGWTPFEAALLRAADELHADAFITDATWNVLASRYNEEQLIGVVIIVGQYNMVSMLLNSLGVQREPGVPGFPGQK